MPHPDDELPPEVVETLLRVQGIHVDPGELDEVTHRLNALVRSLGSLSLTDDVKEHEVYWPADAVADG